MIIQIVLTAVSIAIIFLWDSYLYQVLNIKVRHLLERGVVLLVWISFIACIFSWFATPFYYLKESYVIENVIFVVIFTVFCIEIWYMKEDIIEFWERRKAQKSY